MHGFFVMVFYSEETQIRVEVTQNQTGNKGLDLISNLEKVGPWNLLYALQLCMCTVRVKWASEARLLLMLLD